MPAEWTPAKEGTLSWVCGFALTSKAQNIDAAYALMNFQASPEAQAIRAEDGYLVTNPKAIDAGVARLPARSPVSRRPTRRCPETYPADYPDWVKAFQEFKAQ